MIVEKVTPMNRTTLAILRLGALSLLLAFVLFAAPASAKESDGDDSALSSSNINDDSGDSGVRLPAPSHAKHKKHKSDNLDNAPGDLADSPPMALDNNNDTGPDSLANFGPSSGTVVGNRALELRDEVLRLRSSVNLNSNEFSMQRSGGAAGSVQYHSTVAAITARLQNGTTRGNPILLRQWDEADQALNEVSVSLGRLNTLQSAIESDASLAAYLLESIQAAFELSGAVDEDHDQLKILRDEVTRLVVQLDYLRGQATNDIQRQTNYLTTERSNLQNLAFAISRGELLNNNVSSHPRALSSQAPFNTAMGPGPQPMSPSDFMRESGESPAPYAAPVANVAPDNITPMRKPSAMYAGPPSDMDFSPAPPMANGGPSDVMQLSRPIPLSPTPPANSGPIPLTRNNSMASSGMGSSGMDSGMMSSLPPPMTKSAPMSSAGTDNMSMANASSLPTRGPESGLAPTIGRLLVLIRYNQPVVDYESQLSQAVGNALERRPNAQFSVVAVSPTVGDPADLAKQQATASRNAEAVKRSLVQLGLAPSRISMANTQTQSAMTPEVHIYVR